MGGLSLRGGAALCLTLSVFALAASHSLKQAHTQPRQKQEQGPSRVRKMAKRVAGAMERIEDEIKFRISSVDVYRVRVLERMDKALDDLRSQQTSFAESKLQDMQSYVKKTKELYDEYREQVNRQQARLKEVAQQELAVRRRPIDASLEAFRRRYNESLSTIEVQKQRLESLTQDGLLSQKRKIDDLFDDLERQTRSISESVTNELQQADTTADKALRELRQRLQILLDEAVSSKETLVKSLTPSSSKLDLEKQRGNFDEILRSLAEQQSKWLQQFRTQEGQVETVLNQLRERFQSTNKLYEEIISRKLSGLNVDALNDETLKRVLDCIDEQEGWQLVTDRHGVKVYRKFISQGMFGSKYACVKATSVLAASAEDIYTLFQDNTRVPEYNKYFAAGRDLEDLNDNTKVVWASSPPMFPFKARDFCTVVHFRRLEDGTIVVLNRSAIHPAAPPTPDYVRAQIIMGVNLIQPIKGNPNRCVFTTVTQVDPGGFSPPVIVNQICSQGPVSFFKLVEKAAQTPQTRATERMLPAVKPLNRHKTKRLG